MKTIYLFALILLAVQLQSQSCSTNAGSPQLYCIVEGNTFQLDGTPGTANIANGTGIIWSIINQPTNANASIQDNTIEDPIIDGTIISGDYTFQIQQTCDDNQIITNQVTHTIAVTANLNTLADIDMGCWKTGDLGQTLDLSGISIPSNNSISWHLSNGDGTLTNTSSSSGTFIPEAITNACIASSFGEVRLRANHNNENCRTQKFIEISYNYYDPSPISITSHPTTSTQDCGLITDLIGSCNYNGNGLWTGTGPGSITFSDNSSQFTAVQVSTPGTYNFTWTVSAPTTGSACITGASSITITYNGGGSGLTPFAGTDIEVCASSTTTDITLNATAPAASETGTWSAINVTNSTSSYNANNIININSHNTTAENVPYGATRLRWTISDGICSAYDDVDIQINREPEIKTRNNECGSNTQNQAFFVDLHTYDRIVDPSMCFEITSLPSTIPTGQGGNLQVKVSTGGVTSDKNIATNQILQVGDQYCINQTIDDLLDSAYSLEEKALIVNNNADINIEFRILGIGNSKSKYPGIYEYSLTENACTTQSANNTKQISYNSNVTINAGTDIQNLCGDFTAQLSGSNLTHGNVIQGGWSYISGPNGPDPFTTQAINNEQQSPELTLSEGTHYFKYGTPSVAGCNDESFDTAKVVISNSSPVITTANIYDNTGCATNPNSLRLSAETPPNVLQGEWTQTIGPTLTLPAGNTQDEITAIGTTHGTTYEFDFSADNGCGTPDIETVTVIANNAVCTDFGGLPIELTHFGITDIINNNILLSWSTSSEINNSHFIVEYSNDGISFETAKTIPASNEAQGADYNTSITLTSGGKHYFRLKQIDIDGTTSTFNIVSTEKYLGVTITPTITDNNITIVLSNDLDLHNSFILNMHGQIVKTINLKPGNNHINISELIPGNYIIYIITHNKTYNTNFIKF